MKNMCRLICCGALATASVFASAQSSGDKKFVVYAAQENLNAMALDQVAAQKASNADVKKFAQQMVAEHEDMNSTIEPFAQEWGVTLPTAADAGRQQEIAKLSALSGTAFDKAYLSDVVSGHDEAYKRFKSEALLSRDVPFRDAVGTSRDRLNDHKTQAEALEKKL